MFGTTVVELQYCAATLAPLWDSGERRGSSGARPTIRQMLPLHRLSLGALLLPLLAATSCSSALAPLQSQWGPPQGHGSCAFTASPLLERATVGMTSRFPLGDGRFLKGKTQRAPAGLLLRPACRWRGLGGVRRQLSPMARLRMTDTRADVKDAVEGDSAAEGSRRRATTTLQRTTTLQGTGPLEAICSVVRAVGRAVGLPVEEWEKSNEAATSLEVDNFVAEIDKEVSKWVKQVQEMEDANVNDIRESVDAVYEQLNLGSSLQWSRQSSAADRVVAWRRIRKLTDPSTKSLLISIEKIRWGEERRVNEERVRMGVRQKQRIGGSSAG